MTGSTHHSATQGFMTFVRVVPAAGSSANPDTMQYNL